MLAMDNQKGRWTQTKVIKKELSPALLKKVTIDDSFWAPRIKTNQKTTIPRLGKILEETGQIDPLTPGFELGNEQAPRFFGYFGLFAWIEAASYSITERPDTKLDSLIDDVVEAMQTNEYLNTYSTFVELGKHWTNPRGRSGLAGHLIEAAVAHFQATGKRSLLNVACRYADCIDAIFGTDPGKKPGYPEHEGVELALMKLYQVTGERRYAALARFFVDERGQQPHYYDREASDQNENTANYWVGIQEGSFEFDQSRIQLRDEHEVMAFPVRAMYLYSGMADVAGEFNDEELRAALDYLWKNLTLKKMYITGGIGSSKTGDAFMQDYDLPNVMAYAETCTAIGLVFWAHRMLQFECDGRYADVMERTLYNALLSGVSLDGKKFFYVNSLESLTRPFNQQWFECACCPPNIARLFASLGNYIYSQSKTDAIVHLYIGGTASLDVNGQQANLRVDTDYPWDGKVMVTVEPEAPATFGLALRIPSWCPEFSLKVNKKEMKSLEPQRGYIRIEREWRAGDTVELSLSMPIELVMARPEVREDAGCVAIQRGPLVYCLEQIDNNTPHYLHLPPEEKKLKNRVPLKQIILPGNTKLEAHFEPELLDGVMAIYGDALHELDWETQLYHTVKKQRRPFKIKAIPYYAWRNRERGEMRVWIRSDTHGREDVCN